MILDDAPTPAPDKPWDPWRHGVAHALLIGLATAVGTKLGEWAIERLRQAAKSPSKPGTDGGAS